MEGEQGCGKESQEERVVEICIREDILQRTETK
jgi:hypothetical protein